MKKNTYLLLFALIGLISCKKEMDLTEVIQPEKEVLFTIHIPAGATTSPGEVTKYIITDDSGKILDFHQFNNGDQEVKLSANSDEDHDTFNYYMVSKFGGVMYIAAYIELKRGAVMNHAAPDNYWSEQKTATYKIKNLPDFDLVNYSTSRFDYQLYNIADTTTSIKDYFYKGGDKFYMQIIKGNKAFYNYFDTEPANGILTLDASQCIVPAAKKVISLQKNDFHRFVRIMGRSNRPNDDGQRVGYFEGEPGQDATIFYPKDLASYTTQISYAHKVKQGDEIYQTFGNYYKGTIPGTDVPFATSFNILKDELGDLEIDFTGKFKYYIATFAYHFPITDTNPNALTVHTWMISPSHKQSFKLPDFSSIDINTQSLQKIKLGSLELNDYNCDNLNYFDFVSGRNLPEKYIFKTAYTQYLKANTIFLAPNGDPKLSGLQNLRMSQVDIRPSGE